MLKMHVQQLSLPFYTAIVLKRNLAASEMPLKWIGLKGGPSFHRFLSTRFISPGND